MMRGIVTNATDWRSHKLQSRCKLWGLPISIENERGSYRQGREPNGHFWRTFMHIAYGYIRATEGVDDDHVDCYIGPHRTSERVFVVHQQVPETGKYDEDKVMLGFNSALEAKSAYLRQYDRPGFFQSMDEFDLATFKQMLKDRQGVKLKKSKSLLVRKTHNVGPSENLPLVILTKSRVLKTIKVRTSETGAERLMELLETIKLTGNIGHSFEIVVDPDMREHRKKIGWDGDGSDYIEDVELVKAILEKGKRMPIGTISHGYKKVAEGKWVPVPKGRKKKAVEPETPKGRVSDEEPRGSEKGYGIHNIESGDTISVRAGGKTLSATVTRTVDEGAVVSTPKGERVVPWHKITDFKGAPDKEKKAKEREKEKAEESAKRPAIERMDPKQFTANEWAKQFDDPNVTAETILSKIAEEEPNVYDAIQKTQARLAKVEQTIKNYRISGEGASAVYDPQRARKHEEIIRKIIPIDKFNAAKPPEGEKPVLIMLGGRGGSGKTWFKGQTYDPEKSVVLDADVIKGMLDEYEGWNAFQVHEESSDILEKAAAIAKHYGLNMVIDSTLRQSKHAVDRAEEFKKSGYSVECHYMHVPRQMAAERAVKRFMGKSARYVPVEVVLANKDNEQSFEKIKPMMDAWSFFDNSGDPPPKLVSMEGKGRFSMLKALKYQLMILLKAEKPKPKEEEGGKRDPYDFYDFGPVTPEEDHSPDLKRLIEKFGKEGEKFSKDRAKAAEDGNLHLYKAKKMPIGTISHGYKKVAEGDWRKLPKGRPAKLRYTIERNLGGSTGAYLIKLANGQSRVLKHGNSPEHLVEEYTANQIYKILGVPVPNVELTTTPKGPAQIAEFVNGEPMGSLSREEREKAIRSLHDGFVADALLGNWDVLGMDEDNILWDGSKAWRIDNGGSMRYRAQGEEKGEAFKDTVTELSSLRDPERRTGKIFSGVSEDSVRDQIRNVLSHKNAILAAIDDDGLKDKMEARINALGNYLAAKSMIPDMTLIKSDQGPWYLMHGKAIRFWWFHDLEKALKLKHYYSPEEVKARGMRWVTIRGSKVLIQGVSDGGWVVVGGAGGKLNHLRIDKVLGREEYAARRKTYEKKRKEELRSLTKEEVAEHVEQHRAEVKAKRFVRQAYTSKVTQILGVTPEEIRSEITAKQMDELADKAKQMVEGRAAAKTLDPKALEQEIEKQTQAEVEKAVQKQIKNVERQALETLMNDYMPSDPNAKPELKKLLDHEKAVEILSARKEFRKQMREIGKGAADLPTNLKVGDIFAGEAEGSEAEIETEVRNQIETQKNIRLYDTLNAQAASIQTYVDQGSISALNGLIGDIYGVGATFSTDTVEQLGLEAVVRAVTIKLQQDGKGEAVRKALEQYAEKERETVVTEALQESEKRFKNAEEIRKLAQDTDDAEAILSMASANGYALKQLTAGQRSLGTAVGSLRAVAHMINALEDPEADTVQVDVGKDLARARQKARKAGLPKGTYSIKTLKEGRAKRLVLEIKKDNLNTFFERNAQMRDEESLVDRIKMHKENNGYVPKGMAENVKLDAAQEAGLRFFIESKKVVLDFEAGSGKTAIGYAAATEAMSNMGVKKVLVVVPAKLRGQMYDQRKKFLTKDLHDHVQQANENVSRAERLSRYQKDGIMIIGHDQLRTDMEAIKAAGFGMVIVDEIHQMTSGQGTAGRYRGMMELRDIPLKIGMSGTNIKHRKNELYRKINFIDPQHTLGSMADFEKRYKGLNQGTGMFADAANDAFRKEIAQWVYTQKNALPVKNEVERFRVPLSAEQRKRYAESERIYRKEQAEKLEGASARRDSRTYQIVTDGDQKNNAKLNTLVDTMRQKHPDEKAVVHVYGLEAMRTAAARLEAEWGAGSVGMIHGESGPGEVKAIKASFNDPEGKIKFIVGTSAIESGHNLQHGGTVTFHLDIPESYAAFEQRNARIFRKGQDRDVKTYVLSGTNPMDMRKEDLMETKRREMGILGNPREVEGLDGTGFMALLNRYEEGARAPAA